MNNQLTRKISFLIKEKQRLLNTLCVTYNESVERKVNRIVKTIDKLQGKL